MYYCVSTELFGLFGACLIDYLTLQKTKIFFLNVGLFIFYQFCLGVAYSLAQSPYFHRFTDSDGLPSSTIYDIIQDKKGYIWLGTNAGLCRYDGYEFEIIEVPNSRGSAFHGFQQDGTGVIYFRNFNGQFFSLSQQVVREIELPWHTMKSSNAFSLGASGDIWFVGDYLYAYSPKSKKWKSFSLPTKDDYRMTNGNPLLGLSIFNNRIVYLFNPESGVFRKLQDFSSGEIFKCVWLKGSLFVISTQHEMYRYNFEEDKWFFFAQSKNLVTRMAQDQQGNYWICSPKGLEFLEVEALKVTKQRHFLRNRFVSQMLEDREGNLWFSTVGSGLFLVPNREVINFNADNSPLAFEQINCLAQDTEGNLILGNNGNQVYVLSPEGQLINTYRLPEGDVECLFFDENRQKLWVENRKLLLIDSKTGKIEAQFAAGFTPKHISLYRGDNLIVAAGNAGYALSFGEKEVLSPAYRQNFKMMSDKLLQLRNTRSRATLAERDAKRFWIAYADGLFYYENGQAYEVRSAENETIIAVDFSEDERGNIWVGTSRQGVFRIKNKQVQEHLHLKNHLISNFCRVVKAADEKLYIGTDKGLQIYDIHLQTSQVFSKQDGLPSNEIKDILLKKEQIYLATSSGLSVLNKNLKAINPNPPLIYITGFKIWEKEQALAKSYQLAHDQNNLKIEFRGLSFRSIGKFQYKYRLLGLNPEWIYIESSVNFVRYASLPPGNYTFELKALNEDGVESQKTARLQIRIAYPFWQKWWFVVLMILLGASLISTIFISRIRAIRRQNALEKALQQANLSALKLQMNPHFIFNAISAIQYYMSKPENSRQASRYLAKFAKLVRRVLVGSRQEYISFREEVNLLEDYLSLQSLMQEKPFSYHIRVAPEIDLAQLAIPPMFAQPIIENAVEHGIRHLTEGEGRIELDFSLSSDYIILEIVDNGVGLEEAKSLGASAEAYESLASKITKERIEAFRKSTKKDIKFEIIALEQGTKVVFHLPYREV